MSRPGLPAIALTTDTSFLTAYPNDFGFDGVFARQVQALGSRGDVLIAISTSGRLAKRARGGGRGKARGTRRLWRCSAKPGRSPTSRTWRSGAVARHAVDPAGSPRGRAPDLPPGRTGAVSMTLTIAFAQLNPTVGDVAGNAALVRRTRDEAAAQGADLVVFSELVLVGYPPEDLVLRPALVEAAAAALRDLERESTAPGAPGLVVDAAVASATAGCTTPWRSSRTDATELRFKHELPNYGVFDEKRVFEPGPLPEPVDVPRRPPRPADLRGHLARPTSRRIWRSVAHNCCSSPTARPSRSTSSSTVSSWRARACRKPGCRSPTSTRSAARTSWCSTAARSS